MGMFFDQENSLFDSHAHLNEAVFDADRDEVVERAVAAGVMKIIDVGTSLESSKRAVENAKKYPGVVYAAVGIDMENLVPGSELYRPGVGLAELEAEVAQLSVLIDENKEQVVAIGETGIDAYWLARMQKDGKISAAEVEEIIQAQKQLLYKHIDLAVKTDLPLTIHSRGAEDLVRESIINYVGQGKVQAVFHCFTGSYQQAVEIIDSGFALGVGGIVTFKNAQTLRKTFHRLLGELPSDWSPSDLYQRGIYLETDAPFLAPEGKRGIRNEPAFVPDIWQSLLF